MIIGIIYKSLIIKAKVLPGGGVGLKGDSKLNEILEDKF